MSEAFDVVIVGAGILGLGVAIAAAKRGKSVAVIERDAKASGASIRNFGFVTISGQQAGRHWQQARQSREIWLDVAARAGVQVVHRGAVIPAQRPEAVEVLEQFLQSDMGAECRMITADEALAQVPILDPKAIRACLYSPLELRVESREALPKITAWLARERGVTFFWQTAATAIEPRGVMTPNGLIAGEQIFVCPGDDFASLYPQRIKDLDLRKCTLQMMRLGAPDLPRMQAALLSDHSLARYDGFTAMPAGAALIRRIEAEAADARAAGVHLLVVQSADGSLVVGDSHVYGDSAQVFASDAYDKLILRCLDEITLLPERRIIERWQGCYTSAAASGAIIDKPADNIHLMMIAGGIGASISFAVAEEVMAAIY